MIRRAFRPVTKLLLTALLPMAFAAAACPDDYAPRSYEEASDELSGFLEEYFDDANLTLPPTSEERRKLGLVETPQGGWVHPRALKRSGRQSYPVRPGIWKIEAQDRGRTKVHLLLAEPAQLAESEAFNTLNDRLGGPFADYDNPAYGMIFLPEGVRRRWRGYYLEISARAYGVRLDATGLVRTYFDVILTDDTPWALKAQTCKEKNETAAAGR